MRRSDFTNPRDPETGDCPSSANYLQLITLRSKFKKHANLRHFYKENPDLTVSPIDYILFTIYNTKTLNVSQLVQQVFST